MSAGGKRQGGIKAYKGTIESAVQTLSFLITFICGGDRGGGNVREEEEVGERNMLEESGDLVIPSDLQQKKGRTVFFFFGYTRPEVPSKKNSLSSAFAPNTIMNVPKLLPTKDPSLPPPLRSPSQSNCLKSIGRTLGAGAEC